MEPLVATIALGSSISAASRSGTESAGASTVRYATIELTIAPRSARIVGHGRVGQVAAWHEHARAELDGETRREGRPVRAPGPEIDDDAGIRQGPGCRTADRRPADTGTPCRRQVHAEAIRGVAHCVDRVDAR